MASSHKSARWLRIAVVLCVSMQLLLSGFARANAATQNPTPPPAPQQPQTPAPVAPAAGAQAPAAPTPPPQADKPFAEVIKDATPIQGLFTLYKKDESVYLE